MNSYKKLIGNSIIFAIGNLGSKLVSFILVPLYTYYLSTTEYGNVDLITTTVSMLLPIASASIFDAVLRFVMEKNESNEGILSNSLLISFIGLIITVSFYPLLLYFNVLRESMLYMYIILLLQIVEQILNQYTRAIGKVKIFAINGILLTSIIGLLNVIFLVYLGMGMEGYYLSIIIANIISILFLLFLTKAYENIRFAYLDKQLSISMLKYSIPLIPNSLMWWIINASSRYFILYFVGITGNGLFAVASKIPSLITIINQIFTQAWQLSAIEEYENKNKSLFYSNVFSSLSSVMFIGVSLIIIIIKFTFKLLFAEEYYEAWMIVPFLLLSMVFSCFSGFLGTNYIAAKQTKGVFKTSIYGGIISIVLNFLFIPTFGIIGAGVSSMISFFIMFIIRYFDTKKFIIMEIDWKIITLNMVIIFIQISILFFKLSLAKELTIEIFLYILLLFTNIKFLKIIMSFIKKTIRRKK